ncbi:flagellar type III secretion system pore protein FliP [Undibacterium sp. JH2W]|uniref:flagellar type III secretion system pore protein FliP n=1 Tax=Undibacterium sp. JH2W TaxID=3413037 RepID=UPI003BF33E7B
MNKTMSIYRACLWIVLHLFICLGVNSISYARDVSFVAETSASASEASSSVTEESKVDVTEKTQALPAAKSVATNAVKAVSNIPAADVSLSNKIKPSILAAGDTNQALRVILGLTVLAILPAILVSMTAFLRIIIVLSMLRHAIGMQETPPNSALIGLALFLTLFTMAPTLQTINDQAFQPFMSGKMEAGLAYEKTSAPMRDFMARQTREQDLALMVELSKSKTPETMDDISNLQLIPAFMLSELRAAFQIGFVIFLPFLLIDLIVSSILMALGMMMMPPISIALPLKILMFVLIDGWSLVLKALVGSFH